MFAVVTPEKIQLPPGTVLRLPGTWQEYQALSQQLGERSSPRIKYRPGEILLMAPLPNHGRMVHVAANVVTVLLDHLGRQHEAFTPITMDLPEERGIEPDYCFYIDNWAAISGKDRIDWTVDLPPDLVIEVDVTSYTDVNDYLPYRVPEVWLFKKNKLVIHQLQSDSVTPSLTYRYTVASNSQYFPDINVSELISECLQITREQNTSTAILELRRRFPIG